MGERARAAVADVLVAGGKRAAAHAGEGVVDRQVAAAAQVDVAAARERQTVIEIDGAAGGGRDRALAIDRVVDRAPAAEALARPAR